jgi:hypothetical protein
VLGAAAALLLERRERADRVPVDKNPRLQAAGRRGIRASGMNTNHYRCRDCGMETTAGPLTGHQKATSHVGRSRVK